jgi:hypothetical protein
MQTAAALLGFSSTRALNDTLKRLKILVKDQQGYYQPRSDYKAQRLLTCVTRYRKIESGQSVPYRKNMVYTPAGIDFLKQLISQDRHNENQQKHPAQHQTIQPRASQETPPALVPAKP